MDVKELQAFFETPSTGVPWLSPDVAAFVGGASQASVASASLPEGYRLLQTAYVALRFVVLRTHERDFDIRLHDVSRSSNAFVWRSGRRELVLSQGAGLPAWRSHDRNMALPDMVVDKPVLD